MVFSKSERNFSPIELALFEALLEAQSAAVHGSEFLEDCRNGQEPDEEESSFVKAAHKGDVKKLRQLLSQRKKGARPAFLNQARCWTELETFVSVVVGFPEYNKWFDLTALATAAKEMHPDAVYFLLRQGADPTLKGCPSEDEILDPLDAAKDGYEHALRMIHLDLGDVFSFHVKDAKVLADMAFETLEDARKCRAMIAACLPFWKPAPYADAEFCESRAESGFPNRPTDNAAMLKALEDARNSTLGSDEQKELDELKAKLMEKLERVDGKVKRNVLSGTVKWFNANKGYGRIAQEGGDKENEEFFIHKSNIEGSRVLKPQEKVQFQTRPSCNGKLDLAVNVTIIPDNGNGGLD